MHVPPIDHYRPVMEIHYGEFEKYLASYLASDSLDPNCRRKAPSKLTRLTNPQFHELLTDVCDELVGRKNEQEVPFLPCREEFHFKRNQARQKLATLSTAEFKNVSSDVYCELGRRYPELEEDSSGVNFKAWNHSEDHALYSSFNSALRIADDKLGGRMILRRSFTDCDWVSGDGYDGSTSSVNPSYVSQPKTQYGEFERYLATRDFLASDSLDPNCRRKARSKLTRLTNLQFRELLTDVYDELVRRTNKQEEFHFKRNQARQKLATLSTAEFKNVSSDVYCELGRRYPELKENAHSFPKTQYGEFEKILATRDFLASDSLDPNYRRNSRSKLTRLTNLQFRELLTDVYDELFQRKNAQEAPYLAFMEKSPSKPAQERQKFAALSTTQFKELSSDVYFEAGRRYLELKEDPSGVNSNASNYDEDHTPDSSFNPALRHVGGSKALRHTSAVGDLDLTLGRYIYRPTRTDVIPRKFDMRSSRIRCLVSDQATKKDTDNIFQETSKADKRRMEDRDMLFPYSRDLDASQQVPTGYHFVLGQVTPIPSKPVLSSIPAYLQKNEESEESDIYSNAYSSEAPSDYGLLWRRMGLSDESDR